MKWTATTDPNLIISPPYFIRRCNGPSGTQYVLGRDRNRSEECLGGFDTAAEAKTRAEEKANEDRQHASA